MIYGGTKALNINRSIEIINLIDFKQRFEFYTDEVPLLTNFPIGSVIGEKVGIFSNNYTQQNSQKCFILGEPNKTIKMINERTDSAVVELNENTLLVLGGCRGRETSPQNLTEIITLDQLPVNGPDLGPDFPYTIKRQSICILTTLLLAKHGHNILSKAFIFTDNYKRFSSM